MMVRGKEGKNGRRKEEKTGEDEQFFLPSYLPTFRGWNAKAMGGMQDS
jgi:hypothetical protein